MEKAHFEYKKRDGTLREAYGTLQYTFIPENMLPKDSLDNHVYKNFRYFDLDKNEWRSISGDTIEVTVL